MKKPKSKSQIGDLAAKKWTKFIIPSKLSFKGRKIFKNNRFSLRLPPFRSSTHRRKFHVYLSGLYEARKKNQNMYQTRQFSVWTHKGNVPNTKSFKKMSPYRYY